MPDRYAQTLAADLAVTVSKRASRDPGVSIRARGRAHKRKVKQLNSGLIQHPVFGHRDRWVTQSAAMRPGFFTVAARNAAPQVRKEILRAMQETARRITHG
jgi:hypothetical protein